MKYLCNVTLYIVIISNSKSKWCRWTNIDDKVFIFYNLLASALTILFGNLIMLSKRSLHKWYSEAILWPFHELYLFCDLFKDGPENIQISGQWSNWDWNTILVLLSSLLIFKLQFMDFSVFLWALARMLTPTVPLIFHNSLCSSNDDLICCALFKVIRPEKLHNFFSFKVGPFFVPGWVGGCAFSRGSLISLHLFCNLI